MNWQSIETAPRKDDRRLLGWVPYPEGGGEYHIIHWDVVYEYWHGDDYVEVDPSHWSELLPPPT